MSDALKSAYEHGWPVAHQHIAADGDNPDRSEGRNAAPVGPRRPVARREAWLDLLVGRSQKEI
jgi:hypothetical protein